MYVITYLQDMQLSNNSPGLMLRLIFQGAMELYILGVFGGVGAVVSHKRLGK